MKRVTRAIPAVLCSTSIFFLVGCEGSASETSEASAEPASAAQESTAQAAASPAETTPATTAEASPRATIENALAEPTTNSRTASVRASGTRKITPSSVRIEDRVVVGSDGEVQRGDDAGRDAVTDNSAAARRLKDAAAANADSRRRAAAGKRNYMDAANQDAPVVVRPEPAQIFLGEVSTGDAGHGSVKLVNSGDKAMTLAGCKSSCGCTTTNCPEGQEIPPGGSVELEVRLSAGAMPVESLSKTLTYVVEGHPLINVPVSAKVVSFVAIEPAVLDTDISVDGTVTLTAVDDQPFVITSMIPPIISEFSAEPAVEHTVQINWDEYVESAYRGRLTFYTDHPKCRAVYGQVRGIKHREAMANWQEQRAGDRARGPHTDPVQPRERTTDFAPQRVTLKAVDARLHAFTKVDDVESMRNVIEEGADVTARDTNGKSPLHIASAEGNVSAIDVLLEAGADIEARDRGGRTPLMWAVESRDPATVKHLLAAGADLTARDETGGTVLMWASGFGSPETLAAILEAEPEVSVTDDHGMTPLMWAASFGDGERVKMLIDAGMDVNVVDASRGCSALMYASRSSGSVEALQTLIDAGAKLNLVDVSGKTALSWAALLGTPEKVRLLLDAGCDVLKEDFRGWSPLKYAENRRDSTGPAMVSLLKEATAKANGDADQAASETSEPTDPQARR